MVPQYKHKVIVMELEQARILPMVQVVQLACDALGATEDELLVLAAVKRSNVAVQARLEFSVAK